MRIVFFVHSLLSDWNHGNAHFLRGVVTALQARNVPVHYLVLKDEGHGLSRRESLVTAYGATDRFLDRYLWGDTSAEVVK